MSLQGQYWRVALAGGEEEQIFPGSGQMAIWSPDGNPIYFTGWQERANNLWSLTLEDRVARPITDLVGRRGTMGWGKATDGEFLYFTWWEDLGDIWVMDVAEE